MRLRLMFALPRTRSVGAICQEPLISIPRRFAARQTGRSIEVAVAGTDLRIEERPADRIDRHVAVIVKVGGADLIVGVEVPATRVPGELREGVGLALGAVVVIVARTAD